MIRNISDRLETHSLQVIESFPRLQIQQRNVKYAQHLLENKHSIGPININMEVLYVMRKGRVMATLEKFHVYQETNLGRQINDKNTVTQNILFDTILQNVSDRGHPSTPYNPHTQPTVTIRPSTAPLVRQLIGYITKL